jgi:hypothetical protein
LSDSGAHPVGEGSNLSRARKGTTLTVACRRSNVRPVPEPARVGVDRGGDMRFTSRDAAS